MPFDHAPFEAYRPVFEDAGWTQMGTFEWTAHSAGWAEEWAVQRQAPLDAFQVRAPCRWAPAHTARVAGPPLHALQGWARCDRTAAGAPRTGAREEAIGVCDKHRMGFLNLKKTTKIECGEPSER